ncbi:acyl carrier protein [Pseudomonas syringae]|nr:acyl carrier protein [Pseudomonas syringae]MCF5071485.1 acyl carrier protein [Pseudomonas syringae]
MDNADRIRDMVADILGVRIEEAKGPSRFISDLGADSLDISELVMAFEDAFGIEIPETEAEKMVTVQNAIDFINSRS